MRARMCAVVALWSVVVVADEPPPLWSGQLDASYVANSGNTNNGTLGTSGQVVWQPGPYKVGAAGSFVRTQTDDTVGSRRLSSSLRGERIVSSRFSAYSEGSYFSDIPAGTRHQFTINAGALTRIVESEKHPVFVAFSLAKTWERRLLAPNRNFLGSQVDLDVQVHATDTFTVQEVASYIRDFSDPSNWRAKSATALTAAVSNRFALQFSYQVYRNKPDPGKHAIDTTTLASVVINWPGTKKQ